MIKIQPQKEDELTSTDNSFKSLVQIMYTGIIKLHDLVKMYNKNLSQSAMLQFLICQTQEKVLYKILLG